MGDSTLVSFLAPHDAGKLMNGHQQTNPDTDSALTVPKLPSKTLGMEWWEPVSRT